MNKGKNGALKDIDLHKVGNQDNTNFTPATKAHIADLIVKGVNVV